MANNNSPNKFVNAMFGGAQRRREQYAANQDMGQKMEDWENRKLTNPYAGV